MQSGNGRDPRRGPNNDAPPQLATATPDGRRCPTVVLKDGGQRQRSSSMTVAAMGGNSDGVGWSARLLLLLISMVKVTVRFFTSSRDFLHGP
jgi:hypothetical protein